jgi:hypothetical protein
MNNPNWRVIDEADLQDIIQLMEKIRTKAEALTWDTDIVINLSRFCKKYKYLIKEKKDNG